MTSYEYQRAAVDAMLASDSDHYLAFDAGLGKSKVAIDLARQRGVKRLLIVCPLSVVLVWRQEIDRWWPDHPPGWVLSGALPGMDAPEGIYIVTYGAMSKGVASDVVQTLQACPAFDMTVLDEAHYLKNSKAERTRTVFTLLRSRLGRILPMSATPAPNHAGELYAVLRGVRPDLLKVDGKRLQEWEFENRYCNKKTIRVNIPSGGTRMVDVIQGSKNLPDLRARTSSFFIRETKARVLKELPPMIFDILPVTAKAVPVPIEDIETWEETGKLSSEMASVYHRIGQAKLPSVIEYVNDWLEGNVDRQIVVWAIHHDIIDGLMHGLANHAPAKLDGRDTLKDRENAKNRFLEGKARVFVGQIQAGGTGLTLLSDRTKVNDNVFAESSFSPSENYQAASRIHRIGQHDAVVTRFAFADGTFDDRVQAILARKTADFAALFEKDAFATLVKTSEMENYI